MIPFPDKLRPCDAAGEGTVTRTLPAAGPRVTGENVTCTVQLDPPAKDEGQSFVSEKGADVAMLVIARGASPVLDTRNDFGALVVPTI